MASVAKGNARILLTVWRGDETEQPPKHADDQWAGSIGQRRHDARRRRRAAQAVILGIVVAQLVPVPSLVAACSLFAVGALVHLAHVAYDRVEFAVGTYLDRDDGEPQLLQLVQRAMTTRADPFAGVMRPLGALAATASIALAFIGWMGLLAALGVAPMDLPNPLTNIDAVEDSALLLGCSAAVTILAARLPRDVARRIALGHPGRRRRPSV